MGRFRWTDEQIAEMWRLFRIEGKSASQAAAALRERWGIPDISNKTVEGAVYNYEIRQGTRPKRGTPRPPAAQSHRPDTYKASNGVTLARSASL